MKQFIFSLVGLCFTGSYLQAQFAPPVGVNGTTAMYKDSSSFIAWASSGTLVRGLQDISNSSLGYVNVGDSASAFGMAGTTGVVSLGDGGYEILQFTNPIIDGIGPDLAVFENGFNDTFLELAFVEVSSDGSNFFRFPATSNVDTTVQANSFGSTDATKINNLAGKYRGNYGTPFDLADIQDNLLLDKQAITHVKIIDVVGCIQNQYCSRDMNNHKVNDPWPTAFGSSGFDLDAVGVIHNQAQVGIEELELQQLSVYPNPATDILFVSIATPSNYAIMVTNIIGEIVLQSSHHLNIAALTLNDLKQGIYTLTITANGKQKQVKFVKS